MKKIILLVVLIGLSLTLSVCATSGADTKNNTKSDSIVQEQNTIKATTTNSAQKTTESETEVKTAAPDETPSEEEKSDSDTSVIFAKDSKDYYAEYNKIIAGHKDEKERYFRYVEFESDNNYVFMDGIKTSIEIPAVKNEIEGELIVPLNTAAKLVGINFSVSEDGKITLSEDGQRLEMQINSSEIILYKNDSKLPADEQPARLRNKLYYSDEKTDYIMAPLRGVFEALGFEVTLNTESGTFMLTRKYQTKRFMVGMLRWIDIKQVADYYDISVESIVYDVRFDTAVVQCNTISGAAELANAIENCFSEINRDSYKEYVDADGYGIGTAVGTVSAAGEPTGVGNDSVMDDSFVGFEKYLERVLEALDERKKNPNDNINDQQTNKIKIAVIDYDVKIKKSSNSDDLGIPVEWTWQKQAETPNSTSSKFMIESGELTSVNLMANHGNLMAKTIYSKLKGLEQYIQIGAYDTLDALSGHTIEMFSRAIEDRVDIINMSMTFYDSTTGLHNKIEEAIKSGIIVIISAGNDKQNRSKDYQHLFANIPEIIVVGACDENGELAVYEDSRYPGSNYGSAIDIYAPGIGGTSYATARVSAAAALRAVHPGGTASAPANIKRDLTRSAYPELKDGGGAGILNLANMQLQRPPTEYKQWLKMEFVPTSVKVLSNRVYINGAFQDIVVENDDLKALTQFPNLEGITIRNSNVNLLTVFDDERLKNKIRSMDFYNNCITDIKPLASQINLTYLNLRGANNKISDISVINSLIKLEILELGGNAELTDISPIISLKNSLKKLTLDGLSYSGIDYSSLDSLLYLNSLTLIGCSLDNLNLLPQSLIKLEIQENTKPLNGSPENDSWITLGTKLSRLQELTLSGCQITDISWISKLTELHTLDLSGNSGLDDISVLYSLRNLRYINLYGTNVDRSDIEQLQQNNERCKIVAPDYE